MVMSAQRDLLREVLQVGREQEGCANPQEDRQAVPKWRVRAVPLCPGSEGRKPGNLATCWHGAKCF
jgi:hypothetical protein